MKKTIIVYDGLCNFCQGLINSMLKIANPVYFELISCHYMDSAELAHEISQEDCNKYIHVITPDDKLYKGADAVREIWLRLDHWSKPLAYLLKLPGVIHLARVGYILVSKNRHRIPRIH